MFDLTSTTQIRHRHYLDHQTRPAGEMLRSLTSTSVWIILLPCKTSLLPLLKDILNKILPQRGVNLACLRSVGAGLRCDILWKVSK